MVKNYKLAYSNGFSIEDSTEEIYGVAHPITNITISVSDKSIEITLDDFRQIIADATDFYIKVKDK